MCVYYSKNHTLQFFFEYHMQATDKLKSEEELAKEEKERLDKLEVNYLP